jgi:hypothetical protein
MENVTSSGQLILGSVDINLVIGQGKMPNQVSTARVNFVIDSDGETVKAEVVQFNFKCDTATAASPTATASSGTGGAPRAMGAGVLLVGAGLVAARRRIFLTRQQLTTSPLEPSGGLSVA